MRLCYMQEARVIRTAASFHPNVLLTSIPRVGSPSNSIMFVNIQWNPA